MPTDILIVDDKRIDLDTIGRAIGMHLNIEPYLAEKPEDAITILKNYRIKVLVTDHLFPNSRMTGADLITKVKNELNLRMPCIMITGEKQSLSQEELGNLRLFRLVDKSKPIIELKTIIREALMEYQRDILNQDMKDLDIIIYDRKTYSGIKPRVTLKIIKLISINDSYTRDKDWHTDYIAQRGTNQIIEISTNHEATSYYESSVQSEILQKCGFDLGKSVAVLRTSIDAKIGANTTTKYSDKIAVNKKYTLEIKDITDSPDEQNYLLHSREYQSTQVYINVNCILQLDCACCHIPHQYDVSINIPTNRISLRHIDHFNKGPCRYIYAGTI